MVNFKQIGEALEPLEDPEIRLKILDLGLIYGVEIAPAENPEDGNSVKILVTLTTPACPYGPMLLAQIHGAVAKIPGVRDVNVDLVFDPLWNPRTMATDDVKDLMGLY